MDDSAASHTAEWAYRPCQATGETFAETRFFAQRQHKPTQTKGPAMSSGPWCSREFQVAWVCLWEQDMVSLCNEHATLPACDPSQCCGLGTHFPCGLGAWGTLRATLEKFLFPRNVAIVLCSRLWDLCLLGTLLEQRRANDKGRLGEAGPVAQCSAKLKHNHRKEKNKTKKPKKEHKEHAKLRSGIRPKELPDPRNGLLFQIPMLPS